MSKAIKLAGNGLLLCGLGNALLNAVRQWAEMADNPTQRFNFERLFIAMAKGAGVGLVAGAAYGTYLDYQNEQEKPIDTDAELKKAVTAVKLDVAHPAYQAYSQKADAIAQFLHTEYRGSLDGKPVAMGSARNGTALKEHSDIDFGLLFKPQSFSSTREMLDDVANCLESSQRSLQIESVRLQQKSVGVFVKVGGELKKVDVVPYKLTRAGETSGYLHVNKASFWGDASTYTKTDIPLLNSVKLTKSQEEVVVIFKAWRNENNLPLNSTLLQNLVVDAYAANAGQLPKTLTQRIVMTARHIADHLPSIKLTSIENTNNVLSNIDGEKKNAIVKACRKIAKDYDYQPNSILQVIAKG